MKKKLCSLFCAMVLLLVCTLVPFSAEAALAPLEAYEFFQDFEDESIAVGEYFASEIEGLTNVPLTYTKYNAQATEGKTVEIIEEEGNKMMAMTAAGIADRFDSLFTLPESLDVGKLEASIEFRPEAASSDSWRFFYIYAEAGTSFSTVKLEGGWNGTVLTPAKNAFGNYALRLEASRSSSQEAWKVVVYDESGEEPKVVFEGKTADNFGKIASVKPISEYAMTGDIAGIIDNYKVRITRLPSVKSEDDGLNGAEPFASEMTVGYNAPIPNPADKVTIVKEDDPEIVIETETEYDEETGRLTVKPASFLAYDTKYMLKFEGGGVANHVFETKAAPISYEVESSLAFEQTGPSTYVYENTLLEGTFNAQVKLKVTNNSNDTKSAVALLIAYDANGAMVNSIELQGATWFDDIPAQNTTAKKTITLRNLDALDVAFVELVVMELTQDGGYLPLV